MFHFHKYETLVRERTTIIVTYLGRSTHGVAGLKTLEQCSKCGKLRGYLIDGNGEAQQKVVEVIFSKEEIESALAPF